MSREEKPFEDKYPYSTPSIIRYCLHILICCKTELSRNCCPFSWVSCKTEVRISKELFSFLRKCFIAMHFLWWPSNYVTKNLNILYIQMRIWEKPHDMYSLFYMYLYHFDEFIYYFFQSSKSRKIQRIAVSFPKLSHPYRTSNFLTQDAIWSRVIIYPLKFGTFTWKPNPSRPTR